MVSDIPFDPHKLARTTDPSTSHTAAASCEDLRKRHHTKILEVMDNTRDWNADEISSRCDLDRHQVGRRLHELEEAGYVIKSGQQRPSHAGRMAQCYRVEVTSTEWVL